MESISLAISVKGKQTGKHVFCFQLVASAKLNNIRIHDTKNSGYIYKKNFKLVGTR